MDFLKKIGSAMLKGLKRIQYNSPVVLTYSLAALAVMLIGDFTGNKSTMLLFADYRSSFSDPLAYFRVFGHVLGHANFEHFFNNFLLILLIGPMLEEKYGSKIIVCLIAFTAVVTGVIHLVISKDALLGASGVVFMFILLASFTNLRKGRIPLTLLLCIFIFIGREFVDGISGANAGISQAAHIVGGVCGAAFGFFINRKSLLGSEDKPSEESGDEVRETEGEDVKA